MSRAGDCIKDRTEVLGNLALRSARSSVEHPIISDSDASLGPEAARAAPEVLEHNLGPRLTRRRRRQQLENVTRAASIEGGSVESAQFPNCNGGYRRGPVGKVKGINLAKGPSPAIGARGGSVQRRPRTRRARPRRPSQKAPLRL